MVIDLTWLNSHVRKTTFKMEGLRGLPYLLEEKDLMIACDVKEAFYGIQIHPDDRRFFEFIAAGTRFRMKALPMGYCRSPLICTRFPGVVMAYLRRADPLETAMVKRARVQVLSYGRFRSTMPENSGTGIYRRLPLFHQERGPGEARSVFKYLSSTGRSYGGTLVTQRFPGMRGIPYVDDFIFFLGAKDRPAHEVRELLDRLGLAYKPEKCI